MQNGYGTYVWQNGNKYIGDWKDDRCHGVGVKLFRSGDKVPFAAFIGLCMHLCTHPCMYISVRVCNLYCLYINVREVMRFVV